MRIGIDGRMLYHSGIGRYIQNLLQFLPGPDLKVVVWLNERGMQDPRFDSPYMTKLLSRASLFFPTEQIEIAAQAAKMKLDLFHAPHINAPILYPGRLVVTVHDLIPLLFPGTIGIKGGEQYFKLLTRLSVGRASRVLTVSENTKKDLAKCFGHSSKIQVVYNGVENRYGAEMDPEAKQSVLRRYGIKGPYLLYAGQWKPYKNVTGLVRAFAQLLGNFPDLKLVLVGRVDPRQDILSTAQDLGVEASVICTDYVAQEEDMVALYQEARAFVFPSLYEGFGLPPLEAMAAGIPVVSSNRSSLPEVVGDAAMVVDPEDPVVLAEGIRQVLLDESLRAELVQKGYERIQQFSWETTARSVRQAYEEVLASPR